MVDIRRGENETRQGPPIDTRQSSQLRNRSDVERLPDVQRERSGLARGELTHRTGLDIGRDPFTMMNALDREMHRIFDDFGLGGGLFRQPRLTSDLDRGLSDLDRSIWTPQIETYERDGKLHVSADLPGLKKDDVHIEVLDDTLTIEGERRSEQRDERNGWSERSYGRFVRSIPLPDGINPETAKASFDNGVLDIAFDAPKNVQRRGKEIPIGEGLRK